MIQGFMDFWLFFANSSYNILLKFDPVGIETKKAESDCSCETYPAGTFQVTGARDPEGWKILKYNWWINNDEDKIQ